MSEFDNPLQGITQGLGLAFQLSNMIHNQRLQDQQVALTQRRMAEAEREQMTREQHQETELAMRLNAMGARPMTPSDELEAQTGTAVQFGLSQRLQSGGSAPAGGATLRGGAGQQSPDFDVTNLPETRTDVLPSFAPSDMKSRVVKAGGGKWVLPSKAEREAEEDRAANRETDAAVKRATAVERARGETKLAADKADLETNGIELGDENAKLLGLQPGSRIKAEHMDDYVRAIATAKAHELSQKDTVAHALPMYGEKGSGVAVIKKDGTVSWNPIDDIGKKFTAPQKTSPNQQRLMDDAARKQSVEEAAGHYVGNYEDPDAAVAQLRKDASEDNPYAPFLKKNMVAIIGGIRKAAPKNKASDSNQDVMAVLRGKQATPATPATTGQPVQEGTTIRNPKTGKRMVLRGGQWAPL